MRKKVNFRPLNENVLVNLVEKTISDGGIHLPEYHKYISTGVVEATDNSSIAKNDTVYFIKSQGIELFPNSKKYVVAYKNLLGKAA